MKRAGVFFVVLAVSLGASAQASLRARKSFEKAVPIRLRVSFCSVLQRGVTAQLGGDFATLYDVLPPKRRSEWKTKQSFVESHEKHPGTRPEFLISGVKALHNSGNEDNWNVSGCTYSSEGESFSLSARTTIYRENGEWFIDYLEEVIVIHGNSECPKLKNSVPISTLCGGDEN